MGYDKDEDGNLVINEDEAETVKVIYYLFLNGWSHTEIAELLSEYGRKTKLGNTDWNPTSIAGIIENERHCGYVLAHKTYTPNFKDHKSKKNMGQRNKYLDPEHHEAIVTKEVFDAANQLQASMKFSSANRSLPVLSVIDDGVLKGYVPVHKDWTGFSGEEYLAASEAAGERRPVEIRPLGSQFQNANFKVVRAASFPSQERPALTIDNGKLRFNTACLKKFQDVEYVELLLNPVLNCLAVRPCEKENPNAIHWGRLRNERWAVSQLACRGLSKALVDILEWNTESKYRMLGQFTEDGNGKMIVFTLDEAVETRTETRVIVPEAPDKEEAENPDEMQEEIVVTEQLLVYPPAWSETFGAPITSVATVSLLEQKHYSGDWDVLRPARELEEMNTFTAAKLAELMQEAEEIMEGWAKAHE